MPVGKGLNSQGKPRSRSFFCTCPAMRALDPPPAHVVEDEFSDLLGGLRQQFGRQIKMQPLKPVTVVISDIGQISHT
ncbi:MAG: hypothetical protein ACRDRL_18350 [Sciscionella sp.]